MVIAWHANDADEALCQDGRQNFVHFLFLRQMQSRYSNATWKSGFSSLIRPLHAAVENPGFYRSSL
jgi:hypothetical protein